MKLTNQLEWLVVANLVRYHSGLREFLEHFVENPPDEFMRSPVGWIRSHPDLNPKTVEDLDWAGQTEWAKHELDLVKKMGIRLIFRLEDQYPILLKEIKSPPWVLYVRGLLKPSGIHLAIVGSRRSTFYGEKVASMFSQEAAANDMTTISGLARGIDTVVHRATLKSGGTTIAVLGSGLGRIYPKENKNLSEEVATSGALVSEYAIETDPRPFHFPMRNRIIAGLSHGTIVVEGTRKSGALITAALAAENNRDVFSIPGPITSPNSEGPNWLLRQGAIPTQSFKDVLESFGSGKLNFQNSVETNSLISNSNRDQRLLDLLGGTAVHRDKLAEKLNKNTAELNFLLVNLELDGKIQNLPGGLVIKK